MNYINKYHSPFGLMTMASDGESLTGLWFENQKYFAQTLSGDVTEKDLPVFQRTKEWLDIYFRGKNPEFMPDLKLEGTEFRKDVWDILLTIPYGKTMTYGEIGKLITDKHGKNTMSAQAIGGAVGHNPISVIVPCHRVIGANGDLTGYAGGLDLKVKLLALEGCLD